MKQFTIPQFIDVEDKILGPLTVRQFLIMLVCAMFEFFYYSVFDFSLFVVVGLITLAIFGILAFSTINGRPFHFFILNLIQTLKKPGLRIWSKSFETVSKSVEVEVEVPDYIPVSGKPVTSSRLTELSLVVDTSGGYKISNSK